MYLSHKHKTTSASGGASIAGAARGQHGTGQHGGLMHSKPVALVGRCKGERDAKKLSPFAARHEKGIHRSVIEATG